MDVTNYIAIYEGGYTIDLDATTLEEARNEANDYLEVEFTDLCHPPYDPGISYKQLIGIEEA